MRALERILDDPNWKAKDRRTRCFEHVLHLAGKAFIESIGPTSSQSRKRTTTRGNVDPSNEDEDIEDDAELNEEWFFELMDVAEDAGGDDPLDFEPGDVLGKLLALINQVRSAVASRFDVRLCPCARYELLRKHASISPLSVVKKASSLCSLSNGSARVGARCMIWSGVHWTPKR